VGQSIEISWYKKAESLSETAKRFQVKFFERFGKLFFKKVFQGLALALISREAVSG
jgi:hypothetical protein